MFLPRLPKAKRCRHCPPIILIVSCTQIKIAGAELVLVPGIRQAATDAAITAVEKGVNEGIVYGSHNYHPLVLSMQHH